MLKVMNWCRDGLVGERRRRAGVFAPNRSESACEALESRELLSAHIGSAHQHAKVKPQKTIPDYSGHWVTSEGPMDLTQNGKNITGVVSPPDVGDVTVTAKVRGNGSLKGNVIFDLEGTKTIVKYSAHLLPNDSDMMEGTYNLTFVGITHYSYDFTAVRTEAD